MSRKPTGQGLELRRKNGRRVFALRFRALGQRQYQTLPDGTTRQKAEQELANLLADVRRGIWRPLASEADRGAAEEEDPTLHAFASAWLATRKQDGLSPRTIEDYEWALSYHLLPFFKDHQLSRITIREVDS